MSPHRTKRAIVFDFGGVLMKTLDYGPRRALDARLGLPPGHVERIVHASESWRKAQMGLMTPDAYQADVASQLGLDVAEMSKFMATYFSGDVLDSELVDYIRELRRGEFTVGLLSNASIELDDQLYTLGIASLFNPLVISARIGVMKPEPAAYRAVLDRLGRPAEEIVFIDDMPANIEGARMVGMAGLLYVNGMDLRAELEPMYFLTTI